MAGDIDMAKYRLLRLPAPADPQEPLRLSEYIANIAPYLYNEGCRVFNSVNILIGNAAYTVISFDSERYDTDAIHDPAANPSRLTCKTAGKYVTTAHIAWDTHAVGYRELLINRSGIVTVAQWGALPIATTAHRMSIATILHLDVGDFLEVMVWQSSGGNLNIIQGDIYSPEFTMQRIGA